MPTVRQYRHLAVRPRLFLFPLWALDPESGMAAALDAGVVLGACCVVFADGYRRFG